VQPSDWFTTIDLKDAYFHVKIAPKHRKYLRFAFQGVAYEYNRLPLRYSLSPRTFSKCVATALQPLRDHGMRVFFYDLIVIARSREGGKNSPIDPSGLEEEQVEYLGILLDAGRLRATLSESRLETGIPASGSLPAATGGNGDSLTFMQTLGLMAAAHLASRPEGRLLSCRKLRDEGTSGYPLWANLSRLGS